MKKQKLFHYWQCGLDYVYLQNGVSWEENGGEKFYHIQDVAGLHRAIAHRIVTGLSPLQGQDLRFLRSLMDLSQTALAHRMGYSRDAIAKRESDPHGTLDGKMDRILRLIYILHACDTQAQREINEVLDDIAEDDLQRELSLRHESSGWSEAA